MVVLRDRMPTMREILSIEVACRCGEIRGDGCGACGMPELSFRIRQDGRQTLGLGLYGNGCGRSSDESGTDEAAVTNARKDATCTSGSLVVKFTPSNMKHSSQAGFILLMDLMLSMLLMSVLLAMAVPQVVQIQRTNEMIAAKARVANLASVESAISLCNATPGCHPSVALTAQIPPLGSTIRQGAFQYTFTNVGGGLWTYQATAIGSVFSPTGHDFWVGTAGILYCGDWPDTSNPC